MSGTVVVVRRLDTGETERTTITDDYLLVVDGDRYLDHLVSYAGGTVVLTIKRRHPVEPDSSQRDTSSLAPDSAERLRILDPPR